MIKKFFCLAIAVLLSACTLGPNYQRPKVVTPQSWQLEEKETQSLIDTAWWQQFADPVLNNLIAQALKENKDVRIAAARIEEFLGRYGSARAPLYPQVSGTALAQRKKVTEYSSPRFPDTAENPYSDFQLYAGASWEIDIWGRLRRASEAARAELLGSEEGRRATILTVVSAVAIAYTDLRNFDRQLEIAQRTARSRQDSFKLFSLRFERGLISELELRQIEAEVQSALATISFLQKQIVQQENALNVILGRNPGPIPRGKSLDHLELPQVPAGLPSQLLERRPDIRKAEQDLIAANARIGTVKALYFPTISLTGFFGVESTDLSSLFSGPARIWNFSAPITMPIFNAGNIAGQVKAAEAVQQQVLERYQQVIQNAFREVEDALIDQAKSREQMAAQKRQLDALHKTFDLARLRYENGYTSYLEVLDAERGLFNVELVYTQTKGVLFRALINLYKSMGGGWVREAEKINDRRPPPSQISPPNL
jgi:multidrug efflux system outer membrane protein